MAVLVTGFYDLGRFEPRRTPRAEWIKRADWVLGHNHRILLFADPEFHAPYETRERILRAPVPAPDFTDLGRVQENLRRSAISWDPMKDTPRYFCLMKHRVTWMMIATLFPGGDVFTWSDLCLPHRDGETLDEVLRHPPPPNKIRIAEISYVPKFARESIDRYYERHWWPVGGGLWSARASDIQWLQHEMDYEWRTALNHGYVATDEMLLGRILIRHPGRFDTYYADHPSLAENWVTVKGSRGLILEMANRARDDDNLPEYERRMRALDCA